MLKAALTELAQVEDLLEAGGTSQQAIDRLLAGLARLYPEANPRLDPTQGRPLRRGNQMLTHLRVDGAVDPDVLALFARAAAALVERQQREARKEDELARLSRSGALISSRMGVEPTLQAILEMALEVTRARYGIFRLLNETGDLLVTAAVAGDQLNRPLVEALPLEADHITGWVVRNRRSVCIDDLHQEPWSKLYFPLDQLLEMRSELAAPLLGTNGRMEGVLNLESPEPGAFQRGDQLLLEAFASQAVIAIQQARLLDALQEVAERLLTWPSARVLQRLLELALRLLNARGVTIEHRDGRLEAGQAKGPRRSVEMADGMGRFTAYLDNPGEWEHKVLAVLAHHAGLALKNQHRLEELRASQQRQAVAETFAAVGDLAANLLHQLNNKVGVIPVRVEGILDKCSQLVDDTPYLNRNLREIEASAQTALEIVRENLGILRARPTGPVKLAACVERARAELGQLPPLQIELEVPEVMGDFRSITLVFLNLLENAAKALGSQGSISVRGRLEQDRVRVDVSDDGPGIAPSLHEAIFELSPDRSRPHNLGFGLWWVRTLMERLGGSIAVESDGRHGTTFILEFRCIEQPASTADRG